MAERLLRLIVGTALVVLLVWGGLWVIRLAGFGSLLAVSNESLEPVRPDIPFAPLVDTSPDGFFGNATTAFRKTGESIVSTTVKTGSSIVKAFGFVGGAFKKVI